MMKKTIQFVPIIAIAMAGTMSSCVDSGKDLYDPSYETPNPMGDGFAAPDDIDWNMITTKNVSVEVKDEEGGLFAYLVEIYAEDPLTNESASVLAARTANKENNFKFTTAVSLLPTQKGIYVKQPTLEDVNRYISSMCRKTAIILPVNSIMQDLLHKIER